MATMTNATASHGVRQTSGFLSGDDVAAAAAALLGSPATWLGVLLVYVATCQVLRFRTERTMRARFGDPAGDRAALARMTNDEAQQIVEYTMTREFP